MKWIKHFQLFLFDFDGLLVNTENLHFLAYQTVCAEYGCPLKWDFETYCNYAHYDSSSLKNALYQEFPLLQKVLWSDFYQKKKKAYCEHLTGAQILLMPGVEKMLIELRKERISSCVVTNSVKEHVDLIRERHPILNTISHWITRNDYKEPKPHPECYLKAIEAYSKSGQKIVGFEDSLRGFRALQATSATAVLISKISPKEIEPFSKKKFYCFPSLEAISDIVV